MYIRLTIATYLIYIYYKAQATEKFLETLNKTIEKNFVRIGSAWYTVVYW